MGQTSLLPSQHRHTQEPGAPSQNVHTNTRPTRGPGHPHVLGLDAGLLGPDVAIILITLMVPLTLFQLPGGLTRSWSDRSGQERSDSTPTSSLFKPCPPLSSVHQG